LEISSSRIGSAPDCSSFARACAEVSVNPPEICEPWEDSIPSVDRRRGDQLAVEPDREMLLGGFLGDARQLGFLPPVGDFLGHPLEHLLAV